MPKHGRYEVVLVMNSYGSLGYAVLNTEAGQFMDTHLYGRTKKEQDEAESRCKELAHADLLKTHWPDARDPEVLTLLADSEFEPIQEGEFTMHRFHKAAEAVARQRAGLDG